MFVKYVADLWRWDVSAQPPNDIRPSRFVRTSLWFNERNALSLSVASACWDIDHVDRPFLKLRLGPASAYEALVLPHHSEPITHNSAYRLELTSIAHVQTWNLWQISLSRKHTTYLLLHCALFVRETAIFRWTPELDATLYVAISKSFIVSGILPELNHLYRLVGDLLYVWVKQAGSDFTKSGLFARSGCWMCC